MWGKEMAEPITIQKLLDASIDSDTLGEFANEDKVVISRSGLDYPSAPMASRMVVENGLLGATPFTTYAAMTASALTSDSYAIVTNDANAMINGFYEKVGSTWVYLKWNPSAQAKNEMLQALKLYDFDGLGNAGQNLANNQVINYYVGAAGNNLGKLVSNADSGLQAIKVKPSTTYAVQCNDFRIGVFTVGVASSGSVSQYKQTTVITLRSTSQSDVKLIDIPANMSWLFITTHITSLGFDIRNSLWINEGSIIDSGVSESTTGIKGVEFRDVLAQQRLDAISSAAYSKLFGKKWVAIGDSITEKNNRTNKNYHDFIKDDVVNLTVENKGVSGSGFHDRYNTVTSSITTVNPDYITIFFGTNDYGQVRNTYPLGEFLSIDTNTISGRINACLNQLITAYPFAKIAVISSLPRSNNYGSDATPNAVGYTLKQHSDLLQKYAAHYSLPFLNLYEQSNLPVWVPAANTFYFTAPANSSPDGLHPNDAGHRVIADKVKAFLESI